MSKLTEKAEYILIIISVLIRGTTSINFLYGVLRSSYDMQFMHSFQVNIRICQPKNSDVHQGKARGEHHFPGLTDPDVNQKSRHQLFCYVTLSLFLNFYINFFHIYKFTQGRCSQCT